MLPSRQQNTPSDGVHSVPTPLTPLVDRERELDRIVGWLRRPEIRLVTLSGSAGVGKTRLAIGAAQVLAREFADGAHFIDLAAFDAPDQVTTAVAGVLRAPCEQVLLVLDNFEHVLGAAAGVVEALSTCPGAKALVTTRAALRVRGEHELPIQPLPLLDAEVARDLAASSGNPAVKLFVACAQAAQPDFALDADNSAIVNEICARLDGLPLAIELAAAQTNVLSPRAILARLDRRLDLLNRGARDLPPRQQTLRGALAWGYDLLSETQQRLFRQLAVFDGGCSLAAVHAVSALDPDGRVLDTLAALVDHSLLRVEPRPGDEPRYRMLETLREFAVERLAEHPDEDEQVRLRHAQHFAEQHDSNSVRLEDEADNVRAALEWATTRNDVALALRLANRLTPLWRVNGSLAEGRRRFATLLAALNPDAELTPVRVHALLSAGILAEREGDAGAAEAHYREAVQVAHDLGETGLAAAALDGLGMLASARDELEAAHQLFAQAAELGRDQHDRRSQRWSLLHLAFTSLRLGHLAEAQHAAETCLDAWRARHASGRNLRPPPWASLAIAAIELDQLPLAQQLLHEQWAAASADVRRLLPLLYAQASLAAACGEPERALRLAAAAEACSTGATWRMAVLCRPLVERRLAEARTQLRPAAATAAWSSGLLMSVAEALAYARPPEATQTESAADDAGVSLLTAREREVLQLLARGARNREIGQELVISERTAEWHVANVLAKLGLESRAQLVHWFAGRRFPVV
jgi:predicted ATPase/DNA-binding CsgD family transcriptional regulator